MAWGADAGRFRWSGRASYSVAAAVALSATFLIAAVWIPSPSTEPFALIAVAVRALAVVFAVAFAVAAVLYARNRVVEVDALGVRAVGIARRDFDARWSDVGRIEFAFWRDPSLGTWVTFRGRDGSKLGFLAAEVELGKETAKQFLKAVEDHAAALGIERFVARLKEAGKGDLARPREPIHPQ